MKECPKCGYKEKVLIEPQANKRIMLREPERCFECNKVFVSLYPLRVCSEHEGLDEV